MAEWRDITDIFADKGLTVGVTADGAFLFSGQTIKTPAQAPLTKEQQESSDILMELLKPDNEPTNKKYFKFSQIRNGGISINKYIGNSSKVVIPNEINGKPVTEIGTDAFRNNQKLKTVVFPDSLKSINSHAFQDCASLESLVIPPGLTQISDYAFLRCKNLRSLKLPDSIKEIDRWAFLRCEKLEEVYLPDSLRFLGVGAFFACYALKKVYISEQTMQRIERVQRLDRYFDSISSLTFIDPPVGTPST